MDDSKKCYTFARLCLKAGLHNDPILYLKDYITVKPNDCKAHNLLGEVYGSMDQQEISLACYKRSLELRPNEVDVLNKVADIYCTLPDVSKGDLTELVSSQDGVCQL